MDGGGGLGIRDLSSTNKLLLSKLCWKLSSFPGNLAAKTIATKYLYSTSSPFSFRKGSFICRGLKEPWDLFTRSCKWAVGDGKSVNFWEDKWVGHSPLRETIQGPLTLSKAQLKVGNCIRNHQWDVAHISLNLPPVVKNLILCAPISLTNIDDRPISKYAKKDRFVLKLAYNDLFCYDDFNAKNLL